MQVVDKLLRLALLAESRRDPYACIGYLTELLRLQPGNPKAIYLLAVQHAEIGLIDHCLAGLRKAIALEPTLELARLQLGLLLFDRDRSSDARSQFTALQSSSDEAMRIFANAMVLAVDGEMDAAREALESGLAKSTTDPDKRLLMRVVLSRLGKAPVSVRAMRPGWPG